MFAATDSPEALGLAAVILLYLFIGSCTSPLYRTHPGVHMALFPIHQLYFANKTAIHKWLNEP